MSVLLHSPLALLQLQQMGTPLSNTIPLKTNSFQKNTEWLKNLLACQVRVTTGDSGDLLLCLCDIFWTLINSLVCWFYYFLVVSVLAMLVFIGNKLFWWVPDILSLGKSGVFCPCWGTDWPSHNLNLSNSTYIWRYQPPCNKAEVYPMQILAESSR